MNNEVLEQRDTERYSQYNSKKALIARDIAKKCEYFLPYFCYNEETKELGRLFGYSLIYKQNEK